jgi:hypothetical protein
MQLRSIAEEPKLLRHLIRRGQPSRAFARADPPSVDRSYRDCILPGAQAPVRRSDPATPRAQLVTLQDAGNYITKLPKTAHSAPEWLAATEAPDPRRNAWRADNARQDRRHDGAEPACRPRVRSQSQREALGKEETQAG